MFCEVKKNQFCKKNYENFCVHVMCLLIHVAKNCTCISVYSMSAYALIYKYLYTIYRYNVMYNCCIVVYSLSMYDSNRERWKNHFQLIYV